MVWRGIGLIFINYKRKKWWFCSTEPYHVPWPRLTLVVMPGQHLVPPDVKTTKGTASLLQRMPAWVWPWGSSRPARTMGHSDSALPSVLAVAACGCQALGMWPVLTETCYIYTGFQKLLWKYNINRQFLYWSHFKKW